MARYPLIIAVTVFICGIISGNMILPFPLDLWIMSGFLLIFPFIPHKQKPYILIIVLISGGSLRLHVTRDLIPEDHINLTSVDSVLAVVGVIKACHISRDMHNQYVLELDSIYTHRLQKKVSGNIVIFARKHSRTLVYGDRVRLSGPVEKITPVRNPGQFDYRRYQAAKGIYHRFYWSHPDSALVIAKSRGNWLQSMFIQPISGYGQKTFQRFLHGPSAALVQALLLGEKQDLEREKITKFQNVGVVHVLAISGLHVGFIVIFAMTGFSLLRIPRQLRFWLLLVILFIYGAVVQFKPPVVRASLMALFYLYAERLERKPVADNLLAGAALIILIVNPQELFNPGFQFSFVAVAAILHGAGQFDQWIPLRLWIQKRSSSTFFPRLIINIIWMPLLVSLAAVLGTLPLTAYYYGMIPVVVLFANLLVIPLIAGIVMLALFMLILRPFSGFLTTGIGEIIDLIHNLLLLVVDLFADLPFAMIQVTNPSLIMVILLTFSFLSLLYIEKTRVRRIFALLSASILLLLIIPEFENDKALQITFLDVGQGDAAHISFPNGKTMLIDAGGTNHGQETILPFLKQLGTLKLDYIVASHAHDDHIGGMLPLLHKIEIDTMVMSAYPYHSKRYTVLQNTCFERNISTLVVGRGDRIHADPACRIYILHPDSTCNIANNFSGSECNNSSIVLKIQYGNNGIMFTGDLEKSAEPRVMVYGGFLESEILKVAHHGSNTSTSDAFLAEINPVMAVIPVALRNKFRHPSPKTLERLGGRHVRLYRTSHTGAVVLRVFPDHIEKINWRK